MGNETKLKAAIDRLKSAGIVVSLFLDPDARQIETGARLGADAVELHTGQYALTAGKAQQAELVKLKARGWKDSIVIVDLKQPDELGRVRRLIKETL